MDEYRVTSLLASIDSMLHSAVNNVQICELVTVKRSRVVLLCQYVQKAGA